MAVIRSLRGAWVVSGGRIGLRAAVELANVAAGLGAERVGVVSMTRREIAEAGGLAVGSGRRTAPSDAIPWCGASDPVRRTGATKVVTTERDDDMDFNRTKADRKLCRVMNVSTWERRSTKYPMTKEWRSTNDEDQSCVSGP
jgi:hypothetical protein